MADEGRSTRPRAILLDALGTLVRLAPPAPALREALRGRHGVEVSAAEAESAVRAEIAYYRDHILEGSDAPALAALRRRCAAVLRDALPPAAAGVPLDALTDALLASLRFPPYPDVAPALRALRADGVRLVVVSNWDASLHEVLAASELGDLLDGVVTSAELGSSKPDGRIFAHGLRVAGAEPAEAWHVGDDLDADVAGARAAGIEPVLVVRDGSAPPADVRVVRDLAQLRASYR